MGLEFESPAGHQKSTTPSGVVLFWWRFKNITVQGKYKLLVTNPDVCAILLKMTDDGSEAENVFFV